MAIPTVQLAHTPITQEDFASICSDGNTRRICFASIHAHLPQRGPPPDVGRFKLPFGGGVEALFSAETGLPLWRDQFAPLGRWRRIMSEQEFQTVDAWARRQGTRVFLRDCLNVSIALDVNFPESRIRTEIATFEYRAKFRPDEAASEALVSHICATIRDLPYYRDAGLIAAVPARPGKTYDLPAALAARTAQQLGLVDLTPRFVYAGEKPAVRLLTLDQRWAAWEQGCLTFAPTLSGAPGVILLDDTYQSGTSLQFVASRLRAAGAGAIYGLCTVKTRRDTDNA